ncbi:MAG: Bifunctional protein GlmU [Candidatus Shapirobacteria bacterium GW2011_GWF1_38_23]|nr:MAG: Bifunctional protein GlmU [Candidatus Shapirobacteria bacterium GW2011_GWF2_37_20]KKQ64883.1 MAG: Bifunctional protein GlmU [Candidatus Shapirobacteria bacterium GW2011_GWF1_38_23]
MKLVNQAVILAAGECSRFFPFTRRQHKSDFIIAGKPIISRTIEALDRVGITKIEVIQSPQDDQSLQNTFASYTPSHISVRFYTQQEPIGTGNAVIQALPNLENRFLVINPQQINVDEHLKNLDKHQDLLASPDNLIMFSKTTTNPSRYGIFALEGQRVTKIIEKPTDLTGLSNQRNVGVYLLTKDFVNFMNTLPPTEFQLIEAFDNYLQNHPVYAVEVEETSLTLKYAWDLFGINKHIQKGNFYIAPDVKIGPNCKIGPNVNIESGCILENVTLNNSLIGKNTIIKSGVISDSIIGNNCQIGTNFITQTHNSDNTPIQTIIKNKPVSTGMLSFGILIGDNSIIEDNCTSLPGSVLAPDSHISQGSLISLEAL